MKATEKEQARKICDALYLLPQEKQEYLLGYAEGVITMASVMSEPASLTQAVQQGSPRAS